MCIFWFPTEVYEAWDSRGGNDIAGFQDSKLYNKLAGRPHFLQQFTPVVEEYCNLNQKYLIIGKYFALIIAFSLGFLPAG